MTHVTVPHRDETVTFRVSHAERDLGRGRVRQRRLDVAVICSLASSSMARGSGSFKRGGRGNSRFNYRGNASFRGGRGRGRGRGGAPAEAQPQRDEDGNQLAERFEQVKTNDEVDEKLGFARVQEGPTREGWLINMHPVRILRVYSSR